ncbi:hypothetical protein L1049_008148 [Liquidambar formosana]|uniref:F-box protein n=1 Tax=Liquidambar formosana TaxID=63359 RepID=A0AAP0S2K8_LIQFO
MIFLARSLSNRRCSMADWTQLPYDLITTIANYLTSVEDFLAFSSVCRSWRSVYSNKNWTPGPQFPWLMLSEKRNDETRGFFSFDQSKLYELALPEIRGRRCWGSSHGWLVTAGFDLEIELFNPVTRVRIALPPQFEFPKQPKMGMVLDWSRFVYKAIVIKRLLDSRKIDDEYVVMAIYGLERRLAFARPGYNSWVAVKNSSCASFRDVAYFEGCIFALCEMGSLLLCEIDGPDAPRAVQIGSPLGYDLGRWDQLYLVESSGDLLMVIRHDYDIWTEYYYETVDFTVYKFNFDTGNWTEVKDLGDRALFVGHCCSMSLSTSNIVNCQPNSIYFTVDKLKRWWIYEVKQTGRDMGIYNMADKSIKNLYSGVDSPSYYSCPIWVMPALS